MFRLIASSRAWLVRGLALTLLLLLHAGMSASAAPAPPSCFECVYCIRFLSSSNACCSSVSSGVSWCEVDDDACWIAGDCNQGSDPPPYISA